MAAAVFHRACQTGSVFSFRSGTRQLHMSASRHALFDPERQTLLGVTLPPWILKTHIEAQDDFNRWRIPPVAVGLHLCIGSTYAWSVFNDPLTRTLGVVAPSSMDWGLAQVVPTFGVAIATLGLSAAAASRFIEAVGPRCTGLISGICFGTGHLLAAAGVYTHCLPVVIGGYGFVAGIGLGMGYVTPVGTLLRWFPDRKGMAAGMAVAGFGGGAITATALNKLCLSHFYQAPTRLGSQEEFLLQTIEGVRYTNFDGALKEVVVASAADVGTSGLEAGVYLVGSGSTGLAETFTCLGVGYMGMIALCALSFRVPRDDWVPKGWTPGSVATDQFQAGVRSVSMEKAIKLPQFWYLWIGLGCNITAGLGIMSCASTIMNEVFTKALPTIVTPGFCASFVAFIAGANITGRLCWASLSDLVGRKRMVGVYLGVGCPLYLSLPAATAMVEPGAVLPLIMFTGSSMIIYSFYGGMFATIPAYLGDLFGPKHVGGIHGRLLTCWSVAGIVGPQTVAALRERATICGCKELTAVIEPAVFEAKFGAPAADLEMLIGTKTVTLKRLVELMPPGMQDPTPFLYNETFYTSASLLVVGFTANKLIHRIEKHHFDLH